MYKLSLYVFNGSLYFMSILLSKLVFNVYMLQQSKQYYDDEDKNSEMD
jgi:hypothetical protein